MHDSTFALIDYFLSEVSWDLGLGSIDLEWKAAMQALNANHLLLNGAIPVPVPPLLLENQLLVNYCQLVSFSVHSRQQKQQQKSRAKEHKKSIAKQKSKKEKGSPRVNGQQQQQQQRTMQKGKTKSMHKRKNKETKRRRMIHLLWWQDMENGRKRELAKTRTIEIGEEEEGGGGEEEEAFKLECCQASKSLSTRRKIWREVIIHLQKVRWHLRNEEEKEKKNKWYLV